MSERDKFLTEARGERWHKPTTEITKNMECVCGGVGCAYHKNTDFSTWEGFGKLLSGMQGNIPENKLFEIVVTTFLKSFDDVPDRFANAVYEFLKERQP